MPKLKALRGAIGTYGRVAAGGIIDVDEATEEKLLKTKRFARASDQDIEAAQKAQKLALAVQTPGAGPGFMPMPEKQVAADRLAQLIERGEISREKARELVGLEISLSTEEVRAVIRREADEITAQIDMARADLDAREQELDNRERALVEREKAAGDPGAALADEPASTTKVIAETDAATTSVTADITEKDAAPKPDAGTQTKAAKSAK